MTAGLMSAVRLTRVCDDCGRLGPTSPNRGQLLCQRCLFAQLDDELAQLPRMVIASVSSARKQRDIRTYRPSFRKFVATLVDPPMGPHLDGDRVRDRRSPSLAHLYRKADPVPLTAAEAKEARQMTARVGELRARFEAFGMTGWDAYVAAEQAEREEWWKRVTAETASPPTSASADAEPDALFEVPA